MQSRTREGYEEALRLSERILDLEPSNRMVAEYRVVMARFLDQFGDQVAVEISEEEAHALDPDRTPSEVSSAEAEGEESEEEEEEELIDDRVSEVATEPPDSPRR